MIEKRISSRFRTRAQFEGFIETPPLWRDTAFGMRQFPFPIKSPPLLDEYVVPEPGYGPLGKRMEAFFLFYLKHFSDYSVLAHNVQLQGTSATAGEIDFLLELEAAKEILHVELVYKVYLYDPSIKGEVSKWIGPNRNDSLVKKLDRLKQHQLPMLHTSAAKPLLDTLGISKVAINQYTCFKAQLFLPKGGTATTPLINTSCIRGFWIKYQDFTLKEYGGCSFFSPPKQDWSINPDANDLWYDFKEIKSQVHGFIEQKRSPLLWMKKEHGVTEQLFVVWW